jgi:hypothetical protein
MGFDEAAVNAAFASGLDTQSVIGKLLAINSAAPDVALEPPNFQPDTETCDPTGQDAGTGEGRESDANRTPRKDAANFLEETIDIAKMAGVVRRNVGADSEDVDSDDREEDEADEEAVLAAAVLAAQRRAQQSTEPTLRSGLDGMGLGPDRGSNFLFAQYVPACLRFVLS